MFLKSINIFFAILAVFIAFFGFLTAKAGLISNFSDQLSSHIISSAGNHNISFINSSDFSANKTLELFFESDFDLSSIDYTDIDLKADNINLNLGAAPGSGAESNIGVIVSGQTIIFTQNDTDSVPAGAIIAILIGTNASFAQIGDNQVYNPSLAGTYNISLSGSFGDYGTLAIVILNSDSVGLQAEIMPEISFSIRNSEDTADSSFCSLGTISNFGISECSYRLAAETNANQGLRIYIKSDGNLRNDSNSIAYIAENSQVEQGTEGYGLGVQAGTGIIEQGNFTDDDTPLSTADSLLISTNSVYNYIQGNLATSSLIIHKASVSGTTEPGIYSQQIIYSILANY